MGMAQDFLCMPSLLECLLKERVLLNANGPTINLVPPRQSNAFMQNSQLLVLSR